MPPPEVAIITVAPHPVALTTDLPGRLDSTRTAEVRARVEGIVQKRVYREGSNVKAGTLLFNIDPTTMKANVDAAEAALRRAEANASTAKAKYERYKPLAATGMVSKQDFEEATSQAKQGEADVASARAALAKAKQDLSFTAVTAPISGYIGRAQVTEGALVGKGEATLLATIRQIDPIYVNLTQSGTEVLRLRRAFASGELASIGKGQAKVSLITEDGTVYPHPGKLLFSDMSVDETSGAVTLRAEFPNPDGFLMPGMYVRARLEQAVDKKAITVPQQAVVRGPEGASVMVVDAAGKVAAQPVTTGDAVGTEWIVSQGLKAGDRVIVEGLQKAQPGGTVKPVEWKSAPTPSAGTQPAPAAK